MRILLDLDCVLADFVGGACTAHGLTKEQVLQHWPKTEYIMQHAVGRALGREDWDEADFWTPFNGRADFWAELPVLPWANELVDLVMSLTDDWWVVTSASKCDACIPGKAQWLRNFFGLGCTEFERLIPLRAKYLLANEHTILIDDYDLNVTKFRNPPHPHKGGRGIVFPAHHNSLHHLADRPFEYVREALNHVTGASHASAH